MIASQIVDQIASKVVEKLQQSRNFESPQQMTFEDSLHKLFHNKSREWVKYYVIHKYPEILTENGGWITKPAGRGVRIRIIDVARAKKWLKVNNNKIDWNAPEPVTLRRRQGAVKPIKHNNDKIPERKSSL